MYARTLLWLALCSMCVCTYMDITITSITSQNVWQNYSLVTRELQQQIGGGGGGGGYYHGYGVFCKMCVNVKNLKQNNVKICVTRFAGGGGGGGGGRRR